MEEKYEPLEVKIVKIKPPFIKRVFGHQETIEPFKVPMRGERYASFNLEEKKRIMTDLVLRIEKYFSGKRKVDLHYTKHHLKDNGLEKIEIESEDGVIDGKIEFFRGRERLIYASVGGMVGDLWDFQPDRIYVKINFNSTDPKDKEEYLGLVRIIEGIRNDKESL